VNRRTMVILTLVGSQRAGDTPLEDDYGEESGPDTGARLEKSPFAQVSEPEWLPYDTTGPRYRSPIRMRF